MNSIVDAQGDPVQHGNGNGRFRVTWKEVMGWLVAALIAYGTVNARVSVLESRVDSMKSDIGEIKLDVKEILRTR